MSDETLTIHRLTVRGYEGEISRRHADAIREAVRKAHEADRNVQITGTALGDVETIRRRLDAAKERIAALEAENARLRQQLAEAERSADLGWDAAVAQANRRDDRMRPEVREAFDASWNQNKAGYRNLAD